MLCSFLCDNTWAQLMLQHNSRTSLRNKEKRSWNSYVWPTVHFFPSFTSICLRKRKALNVCASPNKAKWPAPIPIQVPRASFKLHVNKQEGNATATKLLAVFHLWIFTWSSTEQEDCYWEKEQQLLQKGRKQSLLASSMLHHGLWWKKGQVGCHNLHTENKKIQWINTGRYFYHV